MEEWKIWPVEGFERISFKFNDGIGNDILGLLLVVTFKAHKPSCIVMRMSYCVNDHFLINNRRNPWIILSIRERK